MLEMQQNDLPKGVSDIKYSKLSLTKAVKSLVAQPSIDSLGLPRAVEAAAVESFMNSEPPLHSLLVIREALRDLRDTGAFNFHRDDEVFENRDGEKFIPRNLPSVFSNIKAIDHLTDKYQTVFAVFDDTGNQSATIQYFSENYQWNIYVDNFPSSKKEFSINLPFSNYAQFKTDMDRAGVNLVFVKAA